MPEWNPQARTLFLQAIEIGSPDERRNFLDAHCAGDNALRAEVDSLLAANASADNFLESPVVPVESKVRHGLSATADLSSTHEKPGTLVGRYKLREQIGEGGMGTVWIAEQTEPLRRKVALKLVKAGMDTKEVLSRFEVERQALALMDHPNIAKVFDGGVTSTGRPFFVMEYVKGIPITQFCDDARQTVQERLQLFVQVCQAVQHAHQKGIIHRDLKPSNILVCLYDGRPIPKIIDFGLAKAMHQPLTEKTLYTAHGLMVGTPLYMSPEQAEFNNLDVDTRTDIYSLGVILYELLTGTTPLERKQVKDAALQEILRLIKEDDPQKPSTKISGSGSLPHIAAQRSLEPTQLSRVVKGDLDWIAMKSLEKDRSRRYETASGLARDVQRYLDDEPVEACPPSLGYKLRKLARRNTRALATAALLGVVVLGALAVVAGSIGWVVRDRQTRLAVVEREVLLALDEVKSAVDDNRDADALAALSRAEGRLSSQEAQVDVRNRVVQWKADLAMATLLSEIQLDKTADDDDTTGKASAVAAYQRAFTGYNLDLDRLDNSQASQHLRESPVKQHLLAALDDWALLQGTFDSSSNQPRDRGHAGNRLLLLARDADSDSWRNEFRLAIGRNDILELEKLAQQCDVTRQRPLTSALLGTRLRQAGQDDALDAAIMLLGRAHELHPKEFCINQALGIAFLQLDSWRAERYLHPCAIQRPTNASIRTALGMSLYANDYVKEAENELREAIRLQPSYAEPHVHLGELLKYQKNLAGAEAEFRQAMKLNPRLYAPSEKLRILLVEQQKLLDAAAAFQEAIDHSPQAAPAYFCLGDVLALLNKSSEAQAAYAQAARLGPSIAQKRRLAEIRNAPVMPAPSSERLEEVSQHYAAMVLKAPDSHGFAMQSAVLLLFLGKRSEYEALCRQMLERFGESEIATAALRTSLTCLLSSPPVGDLTHLEQLARRAIANGETGKLAVLLYGRGRGLAAYRAGRWEEAIKWCAESRNSGQGLNVAESVETHDMVIEAMAYHQMNNVTEARRLYEEANRLIRGRYPGAPTSLGDAWFDWVVYQILRQEAAALLSISPVDESSVDVHIALAQMHLNQGHWAEGAHHLDIVSEARPQDHLLAMQFAVLQLYRRDQKGYDRVCQRMLQRYGDTQDPVEADRTAKACLLANPSVGDLSQLVKLAETAVSDPKHGFYRFFVLVRALATYRQGNWEECLTWCHTGQQQIGDPKQVPFLVAHYYLVQAMAQHRTGKLEGAKSSLLEARKIISETYPGAPNKLTNLWADWMLYEVLRREAELLIQPAALKPATSLDQPVAP